MRPLRSRLCSTEIMRESIEHRRELVEHCGALRSIRESCGKPIMLCPLAEIVRCYPPRRVMYDM
jgi:hypothetical protein